MPKKLFELKRKCSIHDKVLSWETEEIRKNVCRDLIPIEHDNGKYYCLLHLPSASKEKHIGEFTQIVERRLNKAKSAKNEENNNKLSYDLQYNDFRYVWFPAPISFTELLLSTTFVDFSSATFSSYVNFNQAKFAPGINFSKAVFEGDAHFNEVTFEGDAYFKGATFEGNVYFNSVSFAGNADFNLVRFLNLIYFRDALFAKYVHFVGAIFAGDTLIYSTTFEKDVHFNNAWFKSLTEFSEANFLDSVSFSGALFDNTSKIYFSLTSFNRDIIFSDAIVEGSFVFNELNFDDETVLNFERALFGKASLVSLNKLRLRPNWFINVDCEKFTFIDCMWRWTSGKFIDTKNELHLLKRRALLYPPHILLSITCWQLAKNYEANSNFGAASFFRKMANESKRLSEFNGYKVWSVHWWYWLLAFYGESMRRALLPLCLIVLAIFPIIYTNTNFQNCPSQIPLEISLAECRQDPGNCNCRTRELFFSEAIVQSLAVVTFQNVDYRKPISISGEFWIILERILASIQMLLLVLAIRRRFSHAQNQQLKKNPQSELRLNTPLVIFFALYSISITLLALVFLITALTNSNSNYLWINQLPDELKILIMVATAGVLGSSLRSFNDFARRLGSRDLTKFSLVSYLLNVFIALPLATIIYMVVRGFLYNSEMSVKPSNLYSILSLSVLTGLFAPEALNKLRNIAESLLGKEKQGKQFGTIEKQIEQIGASLGVGTIYNYEGYAAFKIQILRDKSDTLIESENEPKIFDAGIKRQSQEEIFKSQTEKFMLYGGREYELIVWFQPGKPNANEFEKIIINNGVESKTAEFSLTPNSNDFSFRPIEKSLAFEIKEKSPETSFQFTAPKTDECELWIEVSQNNRLIEVIHAVLNIRH